MKTKFVWCLIILLVVVTGIVVAGTTGKIAGRVKDAKSGEPLIGVNIIIQGTALGAATDPDGYYVILNVPPGKYSVTISSVGYQRKIVEGVSVSVDLTTKLDVDIEQTAIEVKEVVITAEAPVIKKDLTSSEARVDVGQLKTLPVQEVGQVLSLQAGITVDRGGGIHIRGGRASEVAYWVDGISVSDGYDGGQAVQIDKNSIQELQVISGTFNAEYGQAMSGIINTVTKDGGEKLRGTLLLYSGDYVTSDKELFWNLDKVRPAANFNVEGSLSGPVPLVPALTFYSSARYFRTDGWLYGVRRFNPDGSKADSAFVPMNNRTRLSGQAKLSFNVKPGMKLSVTGIGSSIDYRDYNHGFRLNPDGDVKKYERGYTLSLIWTHSLSSTSFYTINFSHFYKGFKEYLYEDPFDARYNLDPQAFNTDLYEFLKAGTNLHHFNRNTKTTVGKIDYTIQVSRLHLVKAGIEAKYHELYLDDYSIVPEQRNLRYVATIPDLTSPLHEQYLERPRELSLYAQDKLEYENMIVNVGVRVDYFESRGNVLADPTDPNVYLPQKPENMALSLDQRLQQWYKKASPKYSVSPRFGISYPITDQGVLHFSYGHFLQIPSFSNLYQKPGYKVSTASGVQGVYGNPDLNPQKTVMYEFGLQQQLTEVLGFDLTAFYRDTRDWVSTSVQIPVRGDLATATSFYTTFINRDYANTRGITLTVNKRPSHLFSMNFSYTYQVAEGINSNPDEEQGKRVNNEEPSKELNALDWDQTHTANISLGFGEIDWGIYILGRYGSGLPYTPSLNQAAGRGEDVARQVPKNSRRRPPTYTIDLNTFKSFRLVGLDLNVFLKVFNLLDQRNEVDVYGQTGRATASARALGVESLSQNLNRINTVQDYIRRADFYSEPREIQIGVELSF
ncbi:MAG: TonB-dependent receptor [Ignavibacteriales bacterium]|nr:TonB-dependent receptor [Ignavibacteriales bacterium]